MWKSFVCLLLLGSALGCVVPAPSPRPTESIRPVAYVTANEAVYLSFVVTHPRTGKAVFVFRNMVQEREVAAFLAEGQFRLPTMAELPDLVAEFCMPSHWMASHGIPVCEHDTWANDNGQWRIITRARAATTTQGGLLLLAK